MVAPAQARNIHCLSQNLAFSNPAEKAEGRIPVTFNTNGQIDLFVADFTYIKTTDAQGEQSLVLDNEGFAQPTWQVMNLKSGNLSSDSSIINDIYQPNGGNGFFNENPDDTGLVLTGTETLTFTADYQLSSENSDGAVEDFAVIAFNSYCGDTRE